MTLQIETVPCLSDNYAFLAHDPASKATALIDAPESGPILERLAAKNWQLTDVFLTHHHFDHVDGLGPILDRYPARVTGAASDTARLPALDRGVKQGDVIAIGSVAGTVLEVPGHTSGHLAFYFEAARALFSADSLMALGCGRVFEGTMAQMYASLQKMAALPPDTMVYSGHEYTLSNGRFALTIDPGNADLKDRFRRIEADVARGVPTVPSMLSTELATNPFLRAGDRDVQAQLEMQGASEVDVFSEIRKRKDSF